MRIEATPYRHWSQAYRCRAGAAEMIVVTEIGPRILFLNWRGGPNLLYEDATGFEINGWRLYGGHRFTVAPENADSYAADNTPCAVELSEAQLTITAPLASNRTRRSLTITPAQDGDGFDLGHHLENHGPAPWSGALWAITCVPHAGLVAPCDAQNVRFWPGTDPLDWDLAQDHIASVPHLRRGKIGWQSNEAWLASLQSQASLVIHDPDPPRREDCVDGGCNVEIFTCPDYSELETLGGKTVLNPGDSACLRQRWRLIEPGFNLQNWSAIGTEAGCLSLSPRVDGG